MTKKLHRLTAPPATALRLEPRIRLTDKGRALLEIHELRATLHALHQTLVAAAASTVARAAPCAPKRGNPASTPLPAHNAGTVDAPPAHPAGKSGAALAPDKETR